MMKMPSVQVLQQQQVFTDCVHHMTTMCPLVLQVGSTVEVKTNEGLSSEAVISKLTDASLYTVGESPFLLPDWMLQVVDQALIGCCC